LPAAGIDITIHSRIDVPDVLPPATLNVCRLGWPTPSKLLVKIMTCLEEVKKNVWGFVRGSNPVFFPPLRFELANMMGQSLSGMHYDPCFPRVEAAIGETETANTPSAPALTKSADPMATIMPADYAKESAHLQQPALNVCKTEFAQAPIAQASAENADPMAAIMAAGYASGSKHLPQPGLNIRKAQDAEAPSAQASSEDADTWRPSLSVCLIFIHYVIITWLYHRIMTLL
jgi:hypothetical protein